MTSPTLMLAWQPEVLRSGASTLATLADATRAVGARLDSSVRADLAGYRWRGPGASAALQALDLRRQVLLRIAADFATAAHGLLAESARLAGAQIRLRRDVTAVHGEPRLHCDASGTVSISWGRMASEALHDGLSLLSAPQELAAMARLGAVTVLAHDLGAQVGTAMAEVRAADAAAAAVVDELVARARATLQVDEPAILRADVEARVGAGAFAAWLLRVPDTGTDPEDVADWWAAHTPDEQAALAGPRDLAGALGSLDGLPPALRDRVNRAALARRLASYRAQLSALVSTTARAGVAEGDLVRRRALLVAAHQVDLTVAEELRAISAWHDPATGHTLVCQLLLDEPTRWGGRGRVSVALGRVDEADHVAYLVPGLDQRVLPGLDAFVGKARSVYDAARQLAPKAGVAVIAWLGYETPDLPEVAFEDRARSGGALLAQDLGGLRVSSQLRQPHVTVIGHSYGSTTASAAVMLATEAVDDLAFLGSPGVLVNRAAQVRVPAGHVWVGAASADPVSRLSRFGTDPAAADFGARRFDAEAPPGTSLLGQHVHYFDPGSPAVWNLARIVVGAGAGVRLVPGRTDEGFAGEIEKVLLPFDPAAPWDPTFNDPAR